MSDLIKREDAIWWVKTECNPYGKPTLDFESGKKVIEHLEHMPSADRWIPCSERLPQIGQKVLASTKKTVFTQVFKGYYSDPTRWAWENNRVKEIEAWQPLPKLWKGADDEAD